MKLTRSVKRALAVLLSLGAALLFLGCRNWQPAQEEGQRRLPMMRMRPDSIALEIAIANLELASPEQLARLWSELDEQAIPLEQRRVLDQNGLCCGVAPTQLPAVFRELIEVSGDPRQKPTLFSHQQIQNGSGETHPIEVTGAIEQLEWRVVDANQRSRNGRCANATGLFELRTFPQGNGTAQIDLCPKIRHGKPRQTLSQEHDAWTLRPMMEEISLDELAFGCRLKPGETLIVGPTTPRSGLGELFLSDEVGGVPSYRLVLVRLARTQMDDLFAPQKNREPLTTAAQ